MAIYLSAGMMEELAGSLIEGGYDKDTPAAIVYKATHPDEICIVTTLSCLPDAARSRNITKTAVVLVGDVITHRAYDRSKLYDPGFTTGYRKGTSEDEE